MSPAVGAPWYTPEAFLTHRWIPTGRHHEDLRIRGPVITPIGLALHGEPDEVHVYAGYQAGNLVRYLSGPGVGKSSIGS